MVSSIPTKLFETFNKALSKQLTNFIYPSFVKGVFPNVLKKGSSITNFQKR